MATNKSRTASRTGRAAAKAGKPAAPKARKRTAAQGLVAALKPVPPVGTAKDTRGARMRDPHGLFAPSTSATYRAIQVAKPGAVPKAKLVPLIKQAAAIAREESA